MIIISKRRFILSCLVILKIWKTIIEGAHAVVVHIYQALEISLKKEERIKRTEANSFNNSGSSTTSLQASKSVDRNLPTTDFVTSNFYPFRNVPVKNRNLVKASASVASQISTNEVQKTSVPVKGRRYQSALNSSDPFPVYSTLDQVRPTQDPVDILPVLVNTALDQVSMTSPGKNIHFDSIPKNILNIQDAFQTQDSENVIITSESSVCIVSSTDPKHVLKECVSDASQISTNKVQKTSVPVEGKSYPSDLDSSDPFPVYSTLDQVRPTQDQVDSLLVLANTALDQESMTFPGKNISFDSIPKNTLNSQVSIPTQSSENVNITAESSDDKVSRSDPKYILKLNEDNLNNLVSESDTSNITKPVLTETVPKYLDVVTTYQTNATHKRRKIDESEQVQIGIKQGDNIDRSTVSGSPIAAACTKDDIQCTKDDIQCTKDDIQCTKTVIQDKVHLSDTNENIQPKNIINSDQEHTNDANVTSHDISNQANPAENQQIESTKNVPIVTYADFLVEIIPTICDIESIILCLAMERYTRSTLDEEDFLKADLELNQIMNESSKVNRPAGWAPSIGLKYLFEIRNILVNLNNDLESSMNPRNRSKATFFMEKLAVRLQDARKILFDVDKRGIIIRMKMKKLTSVVRNKGRKYLKYN